MADDSVVTRKRAVALLLFAGLAVPAATGIAALEDDDYCSTNQVSHSAYTEGSELDQETLLVPPGVRCVYTQPDGTVSTAEAASLGEFLPVLAGELVVILVVAWRSPRVPAALRLFAVSTLAIGVAGLGGLAGGFIFAGVVGFFIGVPLASALAVALAVGAGERPSFCEFLAAGVASGLALSLSLFWWLFGLSGPAAFGVALALVAPFAYLAGRLVPRLPRTAA